MKSCCCADWYRKQPPWEERKSATAWGWLIKSVSNLPACIWSLMMGRKRKTAPIQRLLCALYVSCNVCSLQKKKTREEDAAGGKNKISFTALNSVQKYGVCNISSSQLIPWSSSLSIWLVWSIKERKLTVCDASQGLVEGGCVAVVGERDAHSSRQKPPGQCEGVLVQEEPGPEALVAHLITLQQQEQQVSANGNDWRIRFSVRHWHWRIFKININHCRSKSFNRNFAVLRTLIWA